MAFWAITAASNSSATGEKTIVGTRRHTNLALSFAAVFDYRQSKMVLPAPVTTLMTPRFSFETISIHFPAMHGGNAAQ